MSNTRLLFMVLALGTIAESACGCAVCFGDQNHSMTQGMNMGILALLGFIFPVLGGFATFIGYLAWRANHPLEIEAGVSFPGSGN
ncbi:MAG: hypothetical protein KDK66_03100 [Deltaproteobacteria bacterium]|nr:hypothetical protein [Deltaproteobacteria bacterium]